MYLCDFGSRASDEWHSSLRLSDRHLRVLGGDEVLVIDTLHSVRPAFSEA